MSLDPLATALVVPPLALLPLPVAGAVIGIRWRRSGLLIAGIGGLLLIVLAMPAVGGALLLSLESGLPLVPPTHDPPQAIVILGGDVSSSIAPGLFGVGPLTLERVTSASALYRRTHLPILVSGGQPFPGPDPALASRMAAVLVHDFHIPVAWKEPNSHSTWQNAARSAAVLIPDGVRSIYLVTHAWHLRRAIFCFRHFGFLVTAAPVRRDRLVLGRWSFVPSVSGWEESYFALHEWIGLVWYHLRY